MVGRDLGSLSLSVSVEVGAHVRVVVHDVVHDVLYACMSPGPGGGARHEHFAGQPLRGKVRLHGKPYDCRFFATAVKCRIVLA